MIDDNIGQSFPSHDGCIVYSKKLLTTQCPQKVSIFFKRKRRRKPQPKSEKRKKNRKQNQYVPIMFKLNQNLKEKRLSVNCFCSKQDPFYIISLAVRKLPLMMKKTKEPTNGSDR